MFLFRDAGAAAAVSQAASGKSGACRDAAGEPLAEPTSGQRGCKRRKTEHPGARHDVPSGPGPAPGAMPSGRLFTLAKQVEEEGWRCREFTLDSMTEGARAEEVRAMQLPKDAAGTQFLTKGEHTRQLKLRNSGQPVLPFLRRFDFRLSESMTSEEVESATQQVQRYVQTAEYLNQQGPSAGAGAQQPNPSHTQSQQAHININIRVQPLAAPVRPRADSRAPGQAHSRVPPVSMPLKVVADAPEPPRSASASGRPAHVRTEAPALSNAAIHPPHGHSVDARLSNGAGHYMSQHPAHHPSYDIVHDLPRSALQACNTCRACKENNIHNCRKVWNGNLCWDNEGLSQTFPTCMHLSWMPKADSAPQFKAACFKVSCTAFLGGLCCLVTAASHLLLGYLPCASS